MGYNDNEALESLTVLALRLQEQIWRSPARKKFNIAFIVDMLLLDSGRDCKVADAISLGRRMINDNSSHEFWAFTRFLEEAVKHYRPRG